MSYLHTDWIGLQETKLNRVDPSIIGQLVGWLDFGFASSLSIDRAGGLLYYWNETCFREESKVCE